MMIRQHIRRAAALSLAAVIAAGSLSLSGLRALAAEGETAPSIAVDESAAGRQVVSFNNDWRYYPGDWTEAQDPALDDSQWLYVNTPHSTIQYTPEYYLQEDLGVFWYRRHFTVPASMEGKEIVLTFEGAMQEATVWLNGEELGVHQGGYTEFAFDISDALNYGDEENVLAVRLDTRPNSSFTPGKVNPDFQYFGGIYRDVYITISEPVHITDPIESDTVAGGGVFLTAPAVSSESATVHAKTEVENQTGETAQVSLTTEIVDEDGSTVASATDGYALPAGEKCSFEQDLTVASPRLWSTDTPELYTVRTTLSQDGETVDLEENTYGIRKVAWERDGFYLNGERVELVGVNLHSETYMLGNAQSDDAIFAEIKRLREYGFNCIRMSHYPHDPAFYAACDRYGVAVIDCLAGWQNFSDTDAFKNSTYEQMRDQIRVNRNHPSVVLWEPSLNESGYTSAWARDMHALVKEEYPEVGDSKAYTSGWRSWDVYDVGVGTPQANVVGDAATYSDTPVFVSEYGDWNFGGYYSTTRVTREPQHYSNANGGEEGMLVQCDNVQSSFAFNRGQSWYSGAAFWQYADYAGFDTEKLTYCGVVDAARIPKFSAYFFQSQRDPYVDLSEYGLDSGPMVFIANFWNEDSTDQVRIFSNCDEVELYLDDVLIARQSPDTQMWAPHGDTDNPINYPTDDSGAYVSTENLEHPPFTFDLSEHTPGQGTLRAVAYLDGEPVAEYTRTAPGEAAQITLEAEDDEPLKLDGSTAKLVWVDVRDADGTIVNTASDEITFTTQGPGFVIGEKTVAVRGGQWAVWVRSTRGEGDITLTATGDGLEGCTITIPTETVGGLPEAPEGGDADETGFVHPEAPAAPVNIFLDKAATASSVNREGQSNAELAEYANDGDESTKWCAAITDTSDNTLNGQHWWQADLGAAYTVEQMEIVFDMAGNYQFQVAVSDDPDFTGYDISEHETLTETSGRATVDVGQKGRYVRIYLNCPASNIWPCLREVSGTGYTDNVALDKPATGSSSYTAPALAVDGDASTFWNTGAMSPAWFQVDLEGLYRIDQVALSFAWADPGDTGGVPIRHSFTIQSSTDGQTWTDVGTWSDMDQEDSVPNVTATVDVDCTARYLRVEDLWAVRGDDGSNQWAEIAEFVAIGETLGEAIRLDYNAPASATSSAPDSDPTYGNDGDPAKYWVPAADDADPSWQYDAQGIYLLGSVELHWNTEGAHKYAISVSTDGESWTTLADHLSEGVSGFTSSDIVSGEARYVRITVEPGADYGFWINSYGYELTQDLEVTQVEALEPVTGETGTAFDSLGLPGTVTVSLTGDKKTTLAVQWDGDAYDPQSTETQTLTGALSPIPGVAVPEGMTAQISVTLAGAPAPEEHTVTFVADGVTVETVTVADGEVLPAADFPAVPEKAGYDGAWDQTGDLTVTGDVTITAVYTAQTYTVTLDVNGGDPLEEDTITVTYGQPYGALPIPTTQEEGKLFDGWRDASGALIAADTLVTATSDHTLTAAWRDQETSAAPEAVLSGMPEQVVLPYDGEGIVLTVTQQDTYTYQWQRDTGDGWTDLDGETSGSYTIPASDIAAANDGWQYRCVVTNTEEGKLPASAETAAAVLHVVQGTQEAPAGLTGVAPTAAGGDGQIVGLDPEKSYEYRAQDEETYTAVEAGAEAIGGLEAGTYLVRLAGTADLAPSPDASVTVPPYEEESVAVTGVSLDRTSATLYTNRGSQTLQLTAQVEPEDADDRTVTWSSSDEDVATVDSTGLVTVHSEGRATITVTTRDGGFTATCTVTVQVYEVPSEDEDRDPENASTVVTRPGESGGSSSETPETPDEPGTDIDEPETPLAPGVFTDVPAGHWASEAIAYVTGQG
ncbi:MAG TPA: discoidin domain-containing protein, partial [Candidatus Intestinimonas stercoravium]|nr:discoidin domain-containing protein [Candidatus Intestinimonas stercoravium]